MQRREFIGSACALSLFPTFATAAEDDFEVAAELQRQVSLGYFDCAIAGTADGLRRASVGGVTGSSLFEVASVSKTFTHLLAALLWQAGKLDLEAPFVRYLPDHALAEKGTDITVRDLALHASGFTNDWMGRAGIYGAIWPFADDSAYERALLSVLPSAPRRTRIVYACHNTILLGFIVERLSGMDLDEAARRFVWGPLGMKATTWRNVPADNPNLVQIYTKGPCPLGTKGDENARHFSRPLGNDGVFTNHDDLRRFAGDLLSRRTFPREVYDLMLTPGLTIGRRRRSFGWDMSEGTNPPGWSATSVNHSGYTGQYLAVDPEKGRSAIILTNLRLTEAKSRAQAFEDRRRLAALLG